MTLNFNKYKQMDYNIPEYLKLYNYIKEILEKQFE